MCSIDLEPCEAFSETYRKARKVHECDSCGGNIEPGTLYLVHFSKFEGACSYGKMCPYCVAARSEFSEAHESLTCTPSYFPQMLKDCISEGDEESDRKWAPMLAAMAARGTARASVTP